MKRSTSTTIRWNFTGDKVRAQQLTGQARKLLGGVEAQKERRGGGFGHRAVTLAGGEKINITSLRGVANVEIYVPLAEERHGPLAMVPYDLEEAPDGWGEPFNDANPRGTPGGPHPEVIIKDGVVARRPQWAELYPEGLFYGTWGHVKEEHLYSWGPPGSVKLGSGRWIFKDGNKHIQLPWDIAEGFTGYKEIVFASDELVVVGGDNGGNAQFYTYTYTSEGDVTQTSEYNCGSPYEYTFIIQKRNTAQFYILDTIEDITEVQPLKLIDFSEEEIDVSSLETATALYADYSWSGAFVASHTVSYVPGGWFAEEYLYYDVLTNMDHQYNASDGYYADGNVFVWVDREGNPIIQAMVAERNKSWYNYKTFSLNSNYYSSAYYNSAFTIGYNNSGYTRIFLGGELVAEDILSGVMNFSHTAQHVGTVPGAPDNLSVQWPASQPNVSGSHSSLGSYTPPDNIGLAWGPPHMAWGDGFYYKVGGVPGDFHRDDILPVLDLYNLPESYTASNEEVATIAPPRPDLLRVYGRNYKLLFEGEMRDEEVEWVEPVYPEGLLARVDAPFVKDIGAI